VKLHFEEIAELIYREMYVRNGVILGSKAAAKAILQAEEVAEQIFTADAEKSADQNASSVGSVSLGTPRK